MKGVVSNYFSINRMPTGRALYALKEMHKVASQRGLEDVEAATEVAVEQGNRAVRVEFSYEQSRADNSDARGKAVELDNRLDAQIGAIQSLVAARKVGDEDDPVVKAARRVLEVVFPRGVAPIIHQSFEVQLGIMKVMLETFDGDLASEVELLGIEREVQRMGQLVEAFEEELATAEANVTTFDEVREARELLHEYVAIVVGQVIAAYPSLDETATRERESLLAPLNDQQERVAADYRRRRRVTDVDPDTGEELQEDDEPIIDDAPPIDAELDEDSEVVTDA